MIREIQNHKNRVLITSDRWHVLRARWTGESVGTPIYERTITSEHDDKDSAVRAGRALAESFQPEMDGRAPQTRDQALIRRPGYRSLKVGQRADGHRA